MEYLPGEKLLLDLIQKGQDSHQAVGYLPDGTMVVVEQASGKIGQTHTVEIVRSLQTAAGRMMFAKLVNEAQSEKRRTQRQSSKSHDAISAAASGELNKAAKSATVNSSFIRLKRLAVFVPENARKQRFKRNPKIQKTNAV